MSNLNKEESAQYLKVVQKGNMDDMFDFAYALGQKHQLESMKNIIKGINES